MSVNTEFYDIDEYLQENFFEEYYQVSALDIWNDCVVVTILSILPTILKLICMNLLLGCLISSSYFSESFLHILTGSGGIYLVTTLESQTGKIIFALYWCITLILLYLKKFWKNTLFLPITLIFLLILCEYYLVISETWLQIRGIIMILTMKTITLSQDMEQVNIVQHFGYTLCSANILFGPWITFSDYLNLFRKPAKKNLVWICSVVKVTVTSVLFVTLSNCWGSYFIDDSYNRWFVAYREAFTFRTSHYFISYLGEAGMIAAGFIKSKGLNQYRFTITEPLEIEFPSSLSMVVKKWNQPMHEFLKKYVFLSFLRYGKFIAVFVTFLVSSFLHGLELKVSMVLLTIGVFSYLQVAPRDKISEIFDCCVKVRPCRACKHKYKRDSITVRIILFLYSIMTIFHLAYLGVLMDTTTDQVGIYQKWHNLYFIGHIIMFFNVMTIL